MPHSEATQLRTWPVREGEGLRTPLRDQGRWETGSHTKTQFPTQDILRW